MKKTLFLTVDSERPDISKIRIAADLLRKGGLVAFPTETVYGLGANALNSSAVLALFEAKKRPLDNPPIVHVGDMKDVYSLAIQVPPEARILMERFWPGPLTLVLKRSKIVPEASVAGLDTIAIRMPAHKVALALLKECKCPVAAPSANLSGKPSPTTAQHVLDDLDGRIDAVLDGGPSRVGVESTVLDLVADPPEILRPGGTSFEALREAVCSVKMHPFVTADVQMILEGTRSPGMKHKHYAPKARVIVVEGSLSNIVEKIKELSSQWESNGERVGIMATDETSEAYHVGVVKSIGSRFNLPAVAQNLFSLLREFDGEKVDVIIAEGVPTEGLGLAVMNRLRKASGYSIIRVS